MNPDILKKKPFYLSDGDIAWVKNTASSLSIREKVAQLFLPVCMDLGIENIDRLLSYKPGGMHRFSTAPAEALRSSALYAQDRSEVPLLMSSDLEFGILGTMGSGGTNFQTQLGVAASAEKERDAERMARIAAREGRMLGFNWSFTPVVDINYNFRSHITALRSFGSDHAVVGDLGSRYIRVLQDEGMAACAKHWPGDGVDERDQHLVTTANTLTMEDWRRSYGFVYRKMIDADVLTIMSAHITLPAYDREVDLRTPIERVLPASISRTLNVGLLREELGFNGLIISDATGMAGLTALGRREEIVPQVINGGCDIFLFSVDDEMDFGILLNATERGVISRERLDEALLRILGLKASLGLHKHKAAGSLVPTEKEATRILGNAEHQEWCTQCVKSSIRLVKDSQGLLPIAADTHRRVLLIQSEPPAFLGSASELRFRDYLENEGFNVTVMSEDVYPSSDAFDLAIYLLNQTRFFGRGSFFAPWAELHKGLMKSMMRFWNSIPTLMISFANPYHLYDAPRVKTLINAYSPIDQIQREVVALITGKGRFQGGDPVDPFCGLEDARL